MSDKLIETTAISRINHQDYSIMIQWCIVNTIAVKKDYISLIFFSMCQYSRVKKKPWHQFFRLAVVIFQISFENIHTKLKAQIDIAVY